MGQENFAGPEYFTEFDPEKFIRDMKQQAEMAEEDKAAKQAKEESDAE